MSIFFEDFSVLLDKKHRFDILPNNSYNFNEAINATVRFAFYLSIILVILMKDIYFVGLFFLIALLSYIYYMIKIKKVQEYYNEQEEEKPCIMEVQKEYTVDDIKSNLKNIIELDEYDLKALKQYYTTLLLLEIPEFDDISDTMCISVKEKINIIQDMLQGSIDRNQIIDNYLRRKIISGSNFKIHLSDDVLVLNKVQGTNEDNKANIVGYSITDSHNDNEVDTTTQSVLTRNELESMEKDELIKLIEDNNLENDIIGYKLMNKMQLASAILRLELSIYKGKGYAENKNNVTCQSKQAYEQNLGLPKFYLRNSRKNRMIQGLLDNREVIDYNVEDGDTKNNITREELLFNIREKYHNINQDIEKYLSNKSLSLTTLIKYVFNTTVIIKEHQNPGKIIEDYIDDLKQNKPYLNVSVPKYKIEDGIVQLENDKLDLQRFKRMSGSLKIKYDCNVNSLLNQRNKESWLEGNSGSGLINMMRIDSNTINGINACDFVRNGKLLYDRNKCEPDREYALKQFKSDRDIKSYFGKNIEAVDVNDNLTYSLT